MNSNPDEKYIVGKTIMFLAFTAANFTSNEKKILLFPLMRRWVEVGDFQKVFYYLREFLLIREEFEFYLREFPLTYNSSYFTGGLDKGSLLKYTKLTFGEKEKAIIEMVQFLSNLVFFLFEAEKDLTKLIKSWVRSHFKMNELHLIVLDNQEISAYTSRFGNSFLVLYKETEILKAAMEN
jgi:hypothetical protein